MKGQWILLLQLLTSFCDAEYSVSIITSPRQGPFKIDQVVQFSCLIEPTPPDPVTYQWRTVETVFGGSSSSSQNISVSYYRRHLRYCWYYCQVLLNQTVLESASKVVEVHGWLYTDEPVVRSFSHGERLELNVNISSSYYAEDISSIAWYHNGTQITPDSKYTIRTNLTNRNTLLTISDMTVVDAGEYKVKINSISYNGYESAECDSQVLPLLELLAVHAPVVFTVQEGCVPAYNPLTAVAIDTHYIREYQGNESHTVILRSVQQINAPILFTEGTYYNQWYRNGISISNSNMFNSSLTNHEELVLKITYSNNEDIIGEYVGNVLYEYYHLRGECRYPYLEDRIFFRRNIVTMSFWSIKSYAPPSSVDMQFNVSALHYLETTVLECTSLGGGPVEAYNLTLWRNGELLALSHGDHLTYTTKPSQYGEYRCVAESVYSTSLLKEKVSFQLIMEIIALECRQLLGQLDDLKMSVVDVLRSLCQEGCSVSADAIEDIMLNCSTSNHLAYLAAAIVYSDSSGTITASTLVSMFQVWLLSAADRPSVMVGTTPVALNQQCLLQLNAISQEACVNLVNSEPVSKSASERSAVVAAGSFVSGVVVGVVMTVTAVFIIICIKKMRGSEETPAISNVCTDAVEMAMKTNQAYESVSNWTVKQEEEDIYEQPPL